jgi:hypothetical protein
MIKSMERACLLVAILCFMGFREVPLRRTLEENEVSVMLNQSLLLGPDPNFCSTSKRYAQETESKAFAMSSLMKRALVFFLLNYLMRLCTRIKLSGMHLFFMKALWFEDTNLDSLRASLLARTFENIFVTL